MTWETAAVSEVLKCNTKDDEALLCPELNCVIKDIDPVGAVLKRSRQLVKSETHHPVLDSYMAWKSSLEPVGEHTGNTASSTKGGQPEDHKADRQRGGAQRIIQSARCLNREGGVFIVVVFF